MYCVDKTEAQFDGFLIEAAQEAYADWAQRIEMGAYADETYEQIVDLAKMIGPDHVAPEIVVEEEARKGNTPCYDRLMLVHQPWLKGYKWCDQVKLWTRPVRADEALPF